MIIIHKQIGRKSLVYKQSVFKCRLCTKVSFILYKTCIGISEHLNMESEKHITLESILTEKQLQHILNETAPGSQIVDYDLKPACQGLAGFLGDHLRLTLHVKEKGNVKNIHLFIKSMPISNKPKSDFISDGYFYARESMMFKVFAEMPDIGGPNPWCAKAFLHNDKILVMPDLSVEGYKICQAENFFDRNHVLVAISSLARFHAAFCNHVTNKSEKTAYNFLDEYGDVITEPTFVESPWLKAGARVVYNLLKEFSPKWKKYPRNLSEQLEKLCIEACNTLKVYEETVNVVIHKDLWANNIMFKYSEDIPTNAILIDFQCLQYAPPAFDVMIFLYLTTCRSFRDFHEREVLDHYYKVFCANLDEPTSLRLKEYTRTDFLRWCEKARVFSLVVAALIGPYVTMEPTAAQKHFDNPDTYAEYLYDRWYPVISHARENRIYMRRNVALGEEIVEKYILKQYM